MIARRTTLGMATGALAGAAGGTFLSAAPAHAALPAPVLGPRMNFAQADKIMAQLGLDAIVVGGGTNLYHATGLDLTAPRMGHTPSVYAVITRRENQRLSLIAPAFLYYYTIALDHRDQGYPAYVYTAPAEGPVAADEPAAQPLQIFNDRGEAPLDAIERERAAVVKKTLAARAAHADLKYALRKALKDLGVTKGRIAVDHATVARVTAEAAPEAAITDADDALRRIRPVKSDVEIALMRIAAQSNAEAALQAARTVRAGADVRELRAAYFAAVAQRGMRGVFMVIDRVSSPTYAAQFRDGQCFSIDCVSEYMGYHGDYARAVFIGEPPKSMQKVTKATGEAWDIVRQGLKPGMRFSEVRAAGRMALKKLGVNYNISFTPHSVGLYHADHVGNAGSPPREDMVLEPGMMLSVDCPLLEAGAGGSSHLEDLTLITKDGAVQINDTAHKTIIV